MKASTRFIEKHIITGFTPLLSKTHTVSRMDAKMYGDLCFIEGQIAYLRKTEDWKGKHKDKIKKLKLELNKLSF